MQDQRCISERYTRLKLEDLKIDIEISSRAIVAQCVQ